MNWLRKFLGKKPPEPAEASDASPELETWRTLRPDGTALMTVDSDTMTPEAQQQLPAELARMSGKPLFEGTVERAYAKDFVPQTDRCPRCGAATEQKTANFVYTTDSDVRVMTAPAGYFCSACPTVIIDEDMIAAGAKQGYVFRQVIGIDHGGPDTLTPFKTWNGEKHVIVLDEDDDGPWDAPGSPNPPSGYRAKVKRKKKLAAKARRRNRR